MAEFPLGINEKRVPTLFNLSMGNRHGLIAGATGTGKTVSLQKIAEAFSAAGISVFTADVKGDLAGLAYPAVLTPKLEERIKKLGIDDFTPKGNPVIFWDIYGKNGHPLRTTVSEMGPLLLGRLLNLNDTQQGVLNAAFSLADDEGLLLLDLKDLRALLDWMIKNATDFQSKYGNIAANTVGAISRALLTLNEAGGDVFFGEPAFKIDNLFTKDKNDKGIIHILDATKLVNDPRLYSTFLLWLLSELFEELPEVGDLEKPKLAFFFDEAHLFFNSAPKPLIEKIEQLVRLIRSKGVGVYFITQTPLDVPESVLGQLGNRLQHALRAFTPKDQKAVKVAATTFRANPTLDTQTVITQLGVGEALVSLLDQNGTPSMVEQIKIYPPSSRMGAITKEEHDAIVQQSPFKGVYEQALDRESAYEIITRKLQRKSALDSLESTLPTKRKAGRPPDSIADSLMKSTAKSLGSSLGRQISRGIFGTIFGKRK